MTLEEALKVLSEGKIKILLYRTPWDSGTSLFNVDGKIFYREDGKEDVLYSPTYSDRTTDDWRYLTFDEDYV